MLDEIKNSLNEFAEYCTDEQLNAIINIANEDFKSYGIRNINDNLFQFTLSYIKIHIYRLFNQFNDFGKPEHNILNFNELIDNEKQKINNMVEKNELVEKYEKMYFLEGVPEEDKLELAQLYEDFTNFLIKSDNCEENFQTLFIPITKKLYMDFKETNYVKVFEMYSEWYVLSELKNDDEIVKGFIEYYKSFKLYLDDTAKNEILKYTLYGGIAKPKYKLDVLTKTLNFEGKTQDEVKLIIGEIACLFTHENLRISMFAIGKLNGEVFSVNDTYDNFEVLNQHLIDGKTIVLYSAEIKNNTIVYRYSLIEDRPLNRIDEIKKRLDKSDNVLFFDKHELDSLKKITKTTKISDYEVLTDDGFVDIEALHKTIPYEVYHLKLKDGKELKCADNHIVFVTEYDETTFEPIGLSEIFVKDLKVGSFVMVSNDNGKLIESEVIEVTNLGYEEVMYDLELVEGSNRRYYTNGILSHNTYLAKLLAEHVFGDEDSLIRIDMTEYMEKHSVSRLIGAPPGYVGYEQAGQLTEKIRRKPHAVVLFDEIEKAHEDVFNILLQIMDEGHVTDGMGRKINFKNTLIILTSNVGAKELSQFGTSVGFQTTTAIANEDQRAKSIIENALKNKFKPEFLNRIDESIIFNSLKMDDIQKIIYNEVEKLEARIDEIGYKIKINKAAIEFLAKEGYDEQYGARPLARTIQRYVEDPIADEILSGNVKDGDVIKIVFDKTKNEIVVKSDKTVKVEEE